MTQGWIFSKEIEHINSIPRLHDMTKQFYTAAHPFSITEEILCQIDSKYIGFDVPDILMLLDHDSNNQSGHDEMRQTRQ